MCPTDLNDIMAFLAVGRHRSFTRASAQLGVSQSALSQIIRGFEARLGLRLRTRTARSVAPTEAGERLLRGAGANPRWPSRCWSKPCDSSNNGDAAKPPAFRVRIEYC